MNIISLYHYIHAFYKKIKMW